MVCAKAENPKNWSIDNVETTSDYIVPYAGLALVARILTNSQFAEIYRKHGAYCYSPVALNLSFLMMK